MKISVLIAAKHAGEKLGPSLESLRRQTFSKWELIVVDHGPPDRTEELVRAFADGGPQASRYERVGGGMSSVARNRLLEFATGDLLAFIEPGDTWSPRHLSQAVQSMPEVGGVVLSDIQIVDRKNGRTLSELPVSARLPGAPVRTLFVRDAIVTSSSAVFHRAVPEKIGTLDTRFHGGEWRDYWFRSAAAGVPFVATRQASCRWAKPRMEGATAASAAEEAVLFYDKHHDNSAVPAAMRRRLLAASLVAQGRLLHNSDPARAARCFWRAWSFQPVHIQTLGQFALTGWTSHPPELPPRDIAPA